MNDSLLDDVAKKSGLFGIDRHMPHLGDTDGLRPPDWIFQGPVYEIFVRNFTSSGSIKGVKEKLEEIKKLGIKTVWLMPIHPIGRAGRKGAAGSPYAIRDYFEIDSALGTKDDLRELVRAVHDLDMRIIMDLVANHAANDHEWMERNPAWFVHADKGDKVRKPSDWTDVTDLNFANIELAAEMKKMIRYWVEEFDIDGYRCDVAGLVPLSFWEEVCDDLLNLKPDLFMLAEWQSSELHKKAFHATYDWVLYWILKDIRKHQRGVSDLIDWINLKKRLFPRQALSLLFTENHDYPRTLVTFGNNYFYPFAALLYFLKGIPLIYAGQENGAGQMPPLFESDPLDWTATDQRIKTFYANLIKLRYQYSGFIEGELNFSSQNGDSVLVMENNVKDKTFHAYLNFSAEEQIISLDGKAPLIGVDLINGEVFDDSRVKLDPYQVCVLDLIEDELLMI